MSATNGHHDGVVQKLHQLPLPNGWVRTTIGEVGDVRLGRQRSPKNRSKDYPTKYLRAANITWNGLDLRDVLDMEFRPKERDTYRLQLGDLLLSEASGSANEVGKPALWNGEIEDCCFQNTVIRFRPLAVIPQFARLAFLNYARNGVFSRVAKGVGIHHLSADRFTALPFLLPPTSEQHRIVAKAEELLTDLDAGVVALRRAQIKLGLYRESVLKAAIEGRLTKQWRNENTTGETGKELLARVLTDRRRKWEIEHLAARAANGAEPTRIRQVHYKEPMTANETVLRTLPNGWCWATLESLADLSGGVTKDRKRAGQKGMREVPYLRVANVQRGYLDLQEIRLIYALERDIESLRLRPGDVLFTEGGDRDKLGRGWVWNGELQECIHQNHVFRARLYSDAINPKFVSYHGNTFGKEWFTRAGKQTTNLASINLNTLRAFPIPLPPPTEQQQVVREVENVLASVARLEAEVEHGLARATRLRQSILKQACEGKLVAQNQTDIPASELLIRIQKVQKNKPTTQIEPCRTRLVSREITFRRAAIVAYTIQRLEKSKSFGRTQLEKTLYLAQTHDDVDLRFAFRRFAAGPFDDAIFKLESAAAKKGWFTTKERTTFGVTYHTARKTVELADQAADLLGPKLAALDRLLAHIGRMTMRQAELFATAYAVWNDLLIDGREADTEAIIAEFYAWDESKKKFKRTDILNRLTWMQKNDYVPSGKGQRTQLRGKKTRLPSRRRKLRK